MNVLISAVAGSSRHNLSINRISDVDCILYLDDSSTPNIISNNGMHYIFTTIEELLSLSSCASIRNIINLTGTLNGELGLVKFFNNNIDEYFNISLQDTYNSILSEFVTSLSLNKYISRFKYMMTARNLINGAHISVATYASLDDKCFYYDLRFGKKTKEDFIRYCEPLLTEKAQTFFNQKEPNYAFHNRMCDEIQNAVESMRMENV